MGKEVNRKIVQNLIVIGIIICASLSIKPCYAIKARIGDGEVNISWIAPVKNEDGTPLNDLDGYYVYRAEDPTDILVRLNEKPLRGVYYTDTGLTNGITYYYYVEIVDMNNNSKRSDKVAVTSLSSLPDAIDDSGMRLGPDEDGDEEYHSRYDYKYVGLKDDGQYGNMYFNATLNDWAKFDINKRTKFDAAISSGLAIMACNKNLYKPVPMVQKQKLNLKIAKYKNSGSLSKLIEK